MDEARGREYDRHHYPYPYQDNRSYKSTGYSYQQRAPPPYGRYMYEQAYPNQHPRNASYETRHWQSLSQ